MENGLFFSCFINHVVHRPLFPFPIRYFFIGGEFNNCQDLANHREHK